MNNNQFKKVIRKYIEDKTSDTGLKVVYSDISNTTRVYYIYEKDYKYFGSIEIHLTDKSIQISIPEDFTKPITIINSKVLLITDYLHLDNVFSTLTNYLV